MKIKGLFATLVATVLALVLVIGCKEQEEVKYLILDKEEIVLPKATRTSTFTVSSNTPWEITGEGITPTLGTPIADAGWFTITPYSGEKNATVKLTLKVDADLTVDQSKEITVTGKGGTLKLLVKFEAKK